jgi:hypothetical protein
MSGALIQRLAASDRFEPAFALDELGARHVDFDTLVGGQMHEHALAELLLRQARDSFVIQDRIRGAARQIARAGADERDDQAATPTSGASTRRDRG